MISVPFADFFRNCQAKLTGEQLKNLSADHQYIKAGNSYLGVSFFNGMMWVHIMVGDIRGMWIVREWLGNTDIERLGFMCRPNSAMHAVAKYYSAEVEQTEQKYDDGTPILRCVIQTQQTQRLKKNQHKLESVA